MSYSYSWHGASRTPSKAKGTAANAHTPSRSSRRTGFLNITHYNAFTRSDGVTFSVGDAVEVYEGTEFAPAQVWLDPYKALHASSDFSSRRRSAGPSTSTSTAKRAGSSSGAAAECEESPDIHTPTNPNRKRAATAGPASGKGSIRSTKGKGKGKMAQREEENDDWIVDDGLQDSVKFGVIIDLFEDEMENMRVAIHWLARPRLLSFLFGEEAGREEELDASHPKELIYTFDPMETSTKSVTSKSSRAEDIHDVSYILSHIKVTSYESFEARQHGRHFQEDGAANEVLDDDDEEPFFIRKALNTRAEPGDGWFYDINWQDVFETGCASGNWEIKLHQEPEAKQSKPQKTKARARSKGFSKQAGKKSTSDRSSGRSKASLKTKDAETRPVGQSDEEEVDAAASNEEESDLELDSEEDEDEDDNDMHTHASSSEDEPSEPETSDDDDVFGARTNSARKRKNDQVAASSKSPSKRQKASAPVILARPSAATLKKAAERAERQQKRLAERQARRLKPRLPLVQEKLIGVGLDDNSMSPFEKARAVLHVGCTPDYLPCRDNEFAEIEAYLEDAIDEGVGSCIYIAGVPGTGKTATVRSVVSSLQQRASDHEIKPFRFLEVNGMKMTDPVQSFSILWEFISGNRASPKQALSALDAHFKTPSPGRDTCVVLVDELDQLVTKKQEVIYNFFNWPNQPHSRLIVLAIANTMDLPERELSNKINSRLGSNRINFTPYDKNQLIEILTTRMEGLSGVFGKDAVGLVAGKVAGVTGDARRALDICRRAVERVEADNNARAAAGQPPRVVTAADIVVVHKEMTSSGLLLFVKRAGLHQRIMLLALSRAIRKVGVADGVEFGDVIRWHLDFCRQTALNPLPTHNQLFSILQSLADMKLVTTEGGRLDHFQRVQANVQDDELELVLRKEARFMHYLR